MNTREFQRVVCFALILCFAVTAISAGDPKPIALPLPKTEGGKPLMDALKERQSTKAFSPKAVSVEQLSSLLWAAFGINRPDSGKRTAPSAMNGQEMDIYVILAEGVYLYDAKAHCLVPVLAQDLRAAAAGGDSAFQQAPVNLVYIADYSKMNKALYAKKTVYSATHAGFIGQNVYLFCASEGLATVFREGMDRPAIREALKLRDDQEIVFAQTVGYPR
ncbi:MAG: SagB/ThcOx family dehydrogenase [bacterium]